MLYRAATFIQKHVDFMMSYTGDKRFFVISGLLAYSLFFSKLFSWGGVLTRLKC